MVELKEDERSLGIEVPYYAAYPGYTVEHLQDNDFSCFDMHVHTKFSPDSSANPEEIIKAAKKLKIGLAITDHNTIEGTVFMHNLSYNEQVPIIPGMEITSSERKDILLYFRNISEITEFYSRYIEPARAKGFRIFNMINLPMYEIIDFAKQFNAVIVIPHPFAPYPKSSFSFFSKNKELVKKIDAVEVCNGMMKDKKNLKALHWAESMKKPYVGGSDAHVVKELGKVLTVFEKGDIDDYLDSLAKGNAFVIHEHVKLIPKFVSEMSMFKSRFIWKKNKS